MRLPSIQRPRVLHAPGYTQSYMLSRTLAGSASDRGDAQKDDDFHPRRAVLQRLQERDLQDQNVRDRYYK